MKILGYVVIATAAIAIAPNMPLSQRTSAVARPPQNAAQAKEQGKSDWRRVLAANAQDGETCFFDRAEVDGMNQICYYSCPSGTAAITISAAALCPLSIEK